LACEELRGGGQTHSVYCTWSSNSRISVLFH